jgi:hypothetical protein
LLSLLVENLSILISCTFLGSIMAMGLLRFC